MFKVQKSKTFILLQLKHCVMIFCIKPEQIIFEKRVTTMQSCKLVKLLDFTDHQATQACVDLAMLLSIPICVVPCCIFPVELPLQ